MQKTLITQCNARAGLFMFLIIFLVMLMGLSPHVLYAAPKSELIQYWAPSNESNQAIIDHSRLQVILDRYVVDKHPSGINRFDYGGVTEKDKQLLRAYISDMGSIDPRIYARAEQKSYWINLYNALTLKLVIEAYPVESIKKIGKGFFSFGPWDDDVITLQGQTLSLNNIEHGILRPIWQDNRIHYAVNCASLGCPNLQKQTFTSKNTHALLDKAAKDYVNHPRGVSLKDSKLVISSIYKWYRFDFGQSDNNIIKHLILYAEPALKQKLSQHTGDVDDEYRWKLNKP